MPRALRAAGSVAVWLLNRTLTDPMLHLVAFLVFISTIFYLLGGEPWRGWEE